MLEIWQPGKVLFTVVLVVDIFGRTRVSGHAIVVSKEILEVLVLVLNLSDRRSIQHVYSHCPRGTA